MFFQSSCFTTIHMHGPIWTKTKYDVHMVVFPLRPLPSLLCTDCSYCLAFSYTSQRGTEGWSPTPTWCCCCVPWQDGNAEWTSLIFHLDLGLLWSHFQVWVTTEVKENKQVYLAVENMGSYQFKEKKCFCWLNGAWVCQGRSATGTNMAEALWARPAVPWCSQRDHHTGGNLLVASWSVFWSEEQRLFVHGIAICQKKYSTWHTTFISIWNFPI